MEKSHKKPWTTPEVERIELTDEILQLFRSKGSISSDLISIGEQRAKRAAAR